MEDWKCKKHKCSKHDIFLNYRVFSENQLATRLQLELSTEVLPNGRHPIVYLDKFCLKDGEPWQAGFLHGLRNSKLALLLISAEGLERIANAHLQEDNVLLEYEYVLEAKRFGNMNVLPLFVKNKDLTQFSNFSIECYPDLLKVRLLSPYAKPWPKYLNFKVFLLVGMMNVWIKFLRL
jgi:hypothetical protein